MRSLDEAYKTNVVNTLSGIKVYQLSYYPHFTHPNNTLYLNSCGDDEFTITPPICATHPLPLPLASNDVNATIEQNIALKLVQQKNQYLADVSRISTYFKRNKSKAVREKGVYPMHLNSLIELAAQDPDPYFFGSYNWYFTGGTLDVMSVNDVEFLFHVSGSNLNVFNSSRMRLKRNRLEVELLDSTEMVSKSSIFEIIKADDGRFVAARQRDNFTIFYLQNESSQQDLSSVNDVPFMSGVFQSTDFYSIDAKHRLKRFDLLRGKETGQMHLKMPKNKSYWCQLRRYNQQLVYADERRIKLYDSRLFGHKESKCAEMSFDNLIESCEDITSIRADATENNLYVATSHQLFVFDVRFGMETNNQLARYTHQMKTPPMAIDASGGGSSGTTANERLIVVSGTFSEDVVMMQHAKNQSEKVRTNSIPQKILSINDSCTYLRRNGLREVAERFEEPNKKVNIGTRLYRNDNKLYLLTEKASSDLFYQEIMTEEEFANSGRDDEKPMENLEPILRKKVPKKPFKATTVTNFKSMRNILRYNLPTDVDETFERDETTRPERWQQSIEQLRSYKDMLSADLLEIWQVDTLKSEPKPESTVLVDGWLRNASTQNSGDFECDEVASNGLVDDWLQSTVSQSDSGNNYANKRSNAAPLNASGREFM